MKKNDYINAELEIIAFDTEDVISTSGIHSSPTETPVDVNDYYTDLYGSNNLG